MGTSFVVGIGFGMTAKFNLNIPLGASQLPGVAVDQPLVGNLNLPAIFNFLVKNTVLVADAIANGGNFEARQRIDIAGG